MSPKRLAIYARVSTQEQSAEAQLLDLREHAKQRGWAIHHEYVDEGVSGTKSKRPALDAMMADAKKRKFDVVLVWRFDRFARSTQHLVNALAEFRHLGIDFVSYQESIDTSSPLGEAIFSIVAAISQLERDIIAERVKAGLRKARAKGKRLGRPQIGLDKAQVIAMVQEGRSVRKIAQALKVSRGTILRILRVSS